MPAAVSHLIDPWLPRQLPAQLAALGELYRAALKPGAGEQPATVGWRLYAALVFAARLAPLPRLAELTGLSVEQLRSVLAEFGDDDAPRLAA